MLRDNKRKGAIVVSGLHFINILGNVIINVMTVLLQIVNKILNKNAFQLEAYRPLQ